MATFNDVEPEYTAKSMWLMMLRREVHQMEKSGVQLEEIYQGFVFAQSRFRTEIRRERIRRKNHLPPHRFA